jgi:hypothetical protein
VMNEHHVFEKLAKHLQKNEWSHYSLTYINNVGIFNEFTIEKMIE